MRPERRNRRTAAGAALVGWLFADLLLALAMIFLVANASGIVLARVPTPTPTLVPTPTTKPTPIPPPCLETDSHTIVLNYDYNGLLQGDSQTIANIKSQFTNPTYDKGSTPIINLTARKSGLVIPYVGAPQPSDPTIRNGIYNGLVTIMQDLGKNQHFLFQQTAYHAMLQYIGAPYGETLIEIYLFSPNGICPPATPLPA